MFVASWEAIVAVIKPLIILGDDGLVWFFVSAFLATVGLPFAYHFFGALFVENNSDNVGAFFSINPLAEGVAFATNTKIYASQVADEVEQSSALGVSDKVLVIHC